MNRFVWLIVTASCLSGNMGDAAMADDLTNQIQSSDLTIRRSALQLAGTILSPSDQDRIAASVCSVVNNGTLDTKFEGGLHTAIAVLGELKSEAGIPCLLKYLTFVPEDYRVEERILTEMYFPAAVSLVSIGKPSVRYMKEILEDDQADDVSKKLATWVIDEIEGQGSALKYIASMAKPSMLSHGQALRDVLSHRRATFEHPDKLPEWERTNIKGVIFKN